MRVLTRVLYCVLPVMISIAVLGDNVEQNTALPVLLPESSEGVLQSKKLYQVAAGPWGDLEYYAAWLKVPDRYQEYFPMLSDRTIWRFPYMKIQQVKSVFSQAGFDTSEVGWHAQFQMLDIPGEGAMIVPYDSFILSITPEQRARLARVLERYSEDRYSRNPVVIGIDDTDEWFTSSGLDPDTIQLMKKLCYRRGSVLLFSDVSYMLSTFDVPEQRQAFMAAIHRVRTLVLQIKVPDNRDYGPIAKYWTNGFKRKSVLPLLNAVSETPGTERLDIAHLLPPTPRKLLYTFPEISDSMMGDLPDCRWTCFNFFNANPQPIMKNIRLQNEIYQEMIEPVTGGPQFGDILILRDPVTGEIMHSVIYIAGDIVFTKNGASMWSPWVLMRYSDMLAIYSVDVVPQLGAYRFKR